MRSTTHVFRTTQALAAEAVLLALFSLSACGLLPERPNYPQAPIRADAPTRSTTNASSAACAKIYWQNLGAARDINKAIIDGGDGGALANASYGPRPVARRQRADGESLGKPIDPSLLGADRAAGATLERRSEKSVELSVQFPGEQTKAYLQAIERWLAQHVAVEVRSCPK